MTTPEHDDAPPAFKLPAHPHTFKTPASIIPEIEMLELLLEISGYQTWHCGCANRRLHLAECRDEIARDGEMMVKT